MDQVKKLNYKGSDYYGSIGRLARHFIQTMDYLAQPTDDGRKIPMDMFEISQILSSKIKQSDYLGFLTV